MIRCLIYLFFFLNIANALELEVLERVNESVLIPREHCTNCFENTIKSQKFRRTCEVLTLAHGCLYVPVQRLDDSSLVLFFRGNFHGQADVPANRYQESIDQVNTVFGIRTLGNKLSLPIYTTTSSNSVFTSEQIRSLAKVLNLSVPIKLTLVAHSGGYRGLYHTLQNLRSDSGDLFLSELVMLDNFYMEEEWIGVFEQVVASGAKCRGFMTDHNVNRYNTRFKPRVPCQVEGPRGFEHNLSVKKCLPEFLRGKSCQTN